MIRCLSYLDSMSDIANKKYKILVHTITFISIITQVIIEILTLSLAEDGVIFRYNHLRRGDYSGRTNFQNSHLTLCQCI